MPRLRSSAGISLRGVPSYTVRLPMAIRPLVGFSSPATARSSVVFPLPEGPSSDTTSPAERHGHPFNTGLSP